jgi:hypothetical protein
VEALDLPQEIVLELLEVISIYGGGLHRIKSGQRRLREDIFEVSQLLLQERVLGRETSVFSADVLLDLLKLGDLLLEVILVIPLAHPASDSALSVLHPPILCLDLGGLTFWLSYTLRGLLHRSTRRFCRKLPPPDTHASCL